MTRICYQENITKGEPQPLTQDIWNELIHRPAVKNICAAIAALDPSAENFNDRKQALKKRLPIIIPHACRFEGDGKRKSANAVPSGLAMLDLDHIDNPHQFFAEHIAPLLSPVERGDVPARGEGGSAAVYGLDSTPAEGAQPAQSAQDLGEADIHFVAITASGHGLRIIGERLQHESIEAAQLRMATALNISEYDAVTKDLARASYVVPSDYILYINTDALFTLPSAAFTEDSAHEYRESDTRSGGNSLRST